MAKQIPEKQTIDEATFVVVYGEYPVALDGLVKPITVNVALGLEASFCPASEDKRSDEAARLRQLAKYVGQGALLPEHQWLLAKPEN